MLILSPVYRVAGGDVYGILERNQEGVGRVLAWGFLKVGKRMEDGSWGIGDGGNLENVGEESRIRTTHTSQGDRAEGVPIHLKFSYLA